MRLDVNENSSGRGAFFELVNENSVDRVRHGSEAAGVDRGRVGSPRLEDVAIVMGLNELAPVVDSVGPVRAIRCDFFPVVWTEIEQASVFEACLAQRTLPPVLTDPSHAADTLATAEPPGRSSLHDFLAIVTHPRIFAPPTPRATAFESIRAWQNSSGLQLLHEGPGDLDKLKRFCVQARWRRRLKTAAQRGRGGGDIHSL